MYFSLLLTNFFNQGAEIEADAIKKISLDYEEAKKLAISGTPQHTHTIQFKPLVVVFFFFFVSF